MPKPDSEQLDRDERAFLAGSLILQAAIALTELRRPAVPPRSAWSIICALKGQHEINGSSLAAMGTHADALLMQLGRFDKNHPERSRRYAVGMAFFSARTAVVGFAVAHLCLLRLRFQGTKTALHAATSGSAAKKKPQILLDDWDDPLGTNPNTCDERSNVGMPVAWSDNATRLEAWRGDKTGPSGAGNVHRLRAERAAVDWLCSLGFDNSGVRIEAVASRLIGKLSTSTIETILSLEGRANGDRAALAVLEAGLHSAELTRSQSILLHRLGSVLRCLEEGYRLPPRKAARQYDPLPGKLFYLLHMRDPFEINGYVSRTHLVLASMRAAGMQPVAITRLGFPHDLARHKHARMPEVELWDGVPVLGLPDTRNGQIGRSVEGYIDAYAERIVELARQYRPAAIQAASNHLNGLAAIKAARLLGIPAVYEVRGIWEITQASTDKAYAGQMRYKMQRRLENLAVQEADRVITISEPLRRFVIENGAAEENVSVVPNGVDAANMRPMHRDPDILARLEISSHEVVIGYIGSIVHYEGLDYLLEAIGRLVELNIKNMRLLIIGDGKELVNLRALAARLGLDKFCIFPGRVPRGEVERLYSIIDIVPLPRRSLLVTELVPPLKPYEAMAAGKAVIVSSVAALAGTVIDGKTGLIVEKDDVDALALALRRLIEAPDLRARLGSNARKWVETNRSVPALAELLGNVYRALELGQ